jgi:hypothetical protein
MLQSLKCRATGTVTIRKQERNVYRMVICRGGLSDYVAQHASGAPFEIRRCFGPFERVPKICFLVNWSLSRNVQLVDLKTKMPGPRRRRGLALPLTGRWREYAPLRPSWAGIR